MSMFVLHKPHEGGNTLLGYLMCLFEVLSPDKPYKTAKSRQCQRHDQQPVNVCHYESSYRHDWMRRLTVRTKSRILRNPTTKVTQKVGTGNNIWKLILSSTFHWKKKVLSKFEYFKFQVKSRMKYVHWFGNLTFGTCKQLFLWRGHGVNFVGMLRNEWFLRNWKQ